MSTIMMLLEKRIDGLLSQRAIAVARLRRSYEAGLVHPGDAQWRNCRRNFGIMRGQLKIAQRELAQYQERHPS